MRGPLPGDLAGPRYCRGVSGADATTPDEAARPTRRRGGDRRTRRDPEAARAQLLAAGLDLAAEQSLGETLGHLRINDLARSAGLTSGAFYHYWAGQDAYRNDVLEVLLAGERADADPALFTVTEHPDGPARALDDLARRAHEVLVADPDHRLELALWAHQDPRALGRIRQRAAAADATLGGVLADCLGRAGRRTTSGWDLVDLATTSVALSDGLRSQHLIDPGAVTDRDDAGGRSWSTPGLLALLLVLGATEEGIAPGSPPVPEPGPLPATVEDNPRRRRLLDLGVAAARDRPTGNAFDHIRADDVARRVGLTIGAFYHYWDSQEDYRDDLVDALFAAERYLDPGGIADQDLAISEADDLELAVRDTTSWYWAITVGHPDNRVQFAFYTLDDPYIASRLSAWNAVLRQTWHTATETLLERFGRRWRDPLSTDLVVLGMSALLDGLVVRQGLGPVDLGPDADGWTRWGRACLAMVLAGSAPEGDEADLATVADEALEA